MVQHYLEALGPALLVAAFFLIFVLNWPRRRTWTRAIACAFVLAVALRYLWWRFDATVLPYPHDGLTFYWVWFLFIIELLAFNHLPAHDEPVRGPQCRSRPAAGGIRGAAPGRVAHR
jgi:cellulose synthase (UDP-forming)